MFYLGVLQFVGDGLYEKANIDQPLQPAPSSWLDNAHKTLDKAVAEAYCWTYCWTDYTKEMPDGEILRRLLALNLERSKK
ncbi:MAG: hypothetical protein NTX45_21585 [Proteobacteria bacterium]|nr:hypothetical protein [Pseudomonadota bacterium]